MNARASIGSGMVAGLLIAVLLLCRSTGVVAADEGNAADFHRNHAGGVRWLVAPEYPSDALERRLTGRVVIEGVVDPATGKLTEGAYRPDKSDSSVFVPALKSVVGLWKFEPPLNECLPTTEPTTAEMAFEIEGEKPRLFLTRGNFKPPSQPLTKVDRPVKRVNPGYPRAMLSRNWTAVVFTRIEIDTAGKVVAVRAKAYSPDTRVEDELEPFRKIVVSTLHKWEFAAAPSDSEGPRIGCYEMRFQLTH